MDIPDKKSLLRHCTLHTTISAAPSFVIAVMNGWTKPSQIIGMLFGIVAFIYAAWIVHQSKPLATVMTSPYASRAFNWTKRVRIIQVALIAITMPIELFQAIFLMPDYTAGILANLATKILGYPSTIQRPLNVPEISNFDLFLQAFLATFIEGWILAAFLGAFCLVLWLLLRLCSLASGNKYHNLQGEINR